MKYKDFRRKKAFEWFVLAIAASSFLSGCDVLPFGDSVIRSESEINQDPVKAVISNVTATPEPTEEPVLTEVPEPTETPESTEASDLTDTSESTETPEPTEVPQPTSAPQIDAESILAAADRLAVQYDYDGAIAYIQAQEGYESSEQLVNAISQYETTRSYCVEYPLDQITHVFFHTLIVDTTKAFDGDSDTDGYNQMMTTISEFNRMIETMYERGYVMVSPHDMATVNEDGTMSRGSILLPEGKIPFVLSQDDVSYYHYMDGDGFASRLVLDENGAVKCEYIEDDGTVSVGNYDMVPLIDAFVAEHPDFSYHGRKGILAMTGYNGVFGYRTDIAYKTGENLQDLQQKFLEEHPDFDYDAEVAAATAIADAMKATGWEFASHTWGHRNATSSTAEELQTDNEKWEAYVAPILGQTDMIIFAFGADIGDWSEYSMDNPKFAYYKSRGYNYYCNVDSNKYWVQITSDCFRMGRRNLDGYRMYYNPDMLSDLFRVEEVWDESRPTPVPPMDGSY